MDAIQLGNQPFKAFRPKKDSTLAVPTQQVINLIQTGRGLVKASPQADQFAPVRTGQGGPDFNSQFQLNKGAFVKNNRGLEQPNPNKGINPKEAVMLHYLLLQSAHAQESMQGGHTADGCPKCSQLKDMANLLGEVFLGVDVNSDKINTTFKKPTSVSALNDLDLEELNQANAALGDALEGASEWTAEDVKWLAALDGDPSTVSREDIKMARQQNQLNLGDLSDLLDRNRQTFVSGRSSLTQSPKPDQRLKPVLGAEGAARLQQLATAGKNLPVGGESVREADAGLAKLLGNRDLNLALTDLFRQEGRANPFATGDNQPRTPFTQQQAPKLGYTEEWDETI